MLTFKTQQSNRWRNEIKVKHLFTEGDTTPELVSTLCTTIVSSLKYVQGKEKSIGNLSISSKTHIDGELEELIGHFEFLKDLATGKIPESEWDDYSFEGDYEEWFNDYLTQLYDLGDIRVTTTENISEKFLFVS